MEVIWTASASEDYLREETVSTHAFAAAIDGCLSLLRVFPEMGSRVQHSTRLRRILTGKKREYGIYYGLTANRITVVALIDLRQDPAGIEKIIRERLP